MHDRAGRLRVPGYDLVIRDVMAWMEGLDGAVIPVTPARRVGSYTGDVR